MIILILRAPTAWTSVWAEDGSTFLGGAIQNGFSAFGQSYEGYLHFIPRVGGAIAAALPIAWAAAVMATFAAIVTAAAAGYVEFASGSQLQRRWVRIGLGLAIPLLPVLRVEAIDNMANLQFIVCFVCFWILLWLPHKWLGQIIGMLVLLAITFSTLLVTFLVPLALFRLLVSRKGRVLAATFLFGISGHWLIVLLIHANRAIGTSTSLSVSSLSWTLHAYASQVINPLVLGGQFFLRFADGRRTILLSLVLMCGLVLSVLFSRVERSRYVAVTGMTAVTSVVVYIGEVLNSGVSDRYTMFPGLLLLTAAAMAIDSHTRRRVSFWARAAFTVAIVVMAWTVNFTPSAYRSTGPQWSNSLAAAKRECDAGAKSVNLPASPSGWLVELPCGAITEG